MANSYHPIPLQRFGLLNDDPSPATRVFSEDPTTDAEASVRQVLENTTTPEGEVYFSGFDSSVTLSSADVDDIATGEGWMAAQTGVKLVGIVGDFAIQAHEDIPIRTPERLNVTEPALAEAEYLMQTQGGARGTHGMIISRNLLTYLQEEDSSGNLAGGWADTDSSGVADGYTATDLNSEAFTGGVQEFYVDTGAGTGSLNVTIPFPIDDQEVTLSAEFTQLHADGDNAIRIEALDGSKSLIGSAFTDKSVGSTGRVFADLTTPANTHYLKCYPARVTNVTTNNTKAKIKDPCLRVDGKTEYVKK